MPPPPKKEEGKNLGKRSFGVNAKRKIKKHEHNLDQQKMMHADVRLRLESVSLEVKSLRASVAETKEPEEPLIQAPLPAPRELPPDNGEQIVPSLDIETSTRKEVRRSGARSHRRRAVVGAARMHGRLCENSLTTHLPGFLCGAFCDTL